MLSQQSMDVDMAEPNTDVANPSQLASRIESSRKDQTQQIVCGDAEPTGIKQQMNTAGGEVPMDASSTSGGSSAWMEKLLPVPTNDTQKVTRANAFAQLVQGWESYMSDDRMIDPFPNFQQPLQMLQGLSLCGHPASGLPSLKAGGYDVSSLVHPLAPPALRHTHSSPSQIYSRSSSVFDTAHLSNSEDFPLPPIALDPFQRSTSTPSAFRQHSNYSAFGTADGSAFTLTSPRYSGISSMGRESSSHSAFGPVQFYSMALEDMERTSIEVQDISDWSKDGAEDSLLKQKAGLKRGAASRAARFLSDVRVLRRRRRARGGRENPAQPASVSSGSKATEEDAEHEQEISRPFDTAVTVISETMFNPNDTSFLSGSSEMSAIVKEAEHGGATDCEDDVCTAPDQRMTDNEETKQERSPGDQQYQQLDSDVEEEVGYQRIETQLQSVSPPILSPTYHNFFNGRPSTSCHAAAIDNADAGVSTDGSPMRVQVCSSQKLRFTMAMESIAASPSPTRMELGGEGSSLTPLSLESATMSPHTTRSSVTGSSSGHTTQATVTSYSTGQQSGLSTISETDREVMQANKDAKRRRGLDSLPAARKTETDGSSNNSSSSNSTNPHRYFSLASSPVTLREGANVPVDRFFTDSPSPGPASFASQPSSLIRANTTSTSSASRRSGSTTSPSTSVSLPVTHTSSSSASSCGEQPPTFVSYLDREASSDLTTFREAMETSSQRAAGNDLEEREASPASEMMVYSELFCEEPLAPSQLRGARLDRFRSRQRPPRSPAKGVRPSKTPPPLGSISPLYHQQLSPPRNIVDHLDSNISRPHVMRSGLASSPALVTSRSLIDYSAWRLSHGDGVDPVSPLIGVGLGSTLTESEILVKRRTYQESSVEVMNTAPGEMAANLVTPEKEGL